MTKQIQGSMIFVKSDELNASDSRQSAMRQKEMKKKKNTQNMVNAINFVHVEYLQNFE